MTKEDGFSIISMQDDDTDEEIVIEAGVSSRPSPKEESEEETARPDKVKSTEKTQPESVQGEDSYQPTTIEDLDSDGPFPKMRIIILVGGLLAIVGIVVYFNFMR